MHERMEAYAELAVATSDPLLRAEARDLLDAIVDDVGELTAQTLGAGYSLYRRVLKRGPVGVIKDVVEEEA